jgi:hypothetical protein
MIVVRKILHFRNIQKNWIIMAEFYCMEKDTIDGLTNLSRYALEAMAE